MLRIQPNKLPNGAMLFPDSEEENRFYLHPPEVRVVRLDFQRDPGGHHRFISELEFGASDEDVRRLPSEFQGQEVVPVPWAAGPVKLWGSWGGRPRLLSQGTNSGLGAQKSVHLSTIPWVPHELTLTTNLVCTAEADGAITKAQWTEDEGHLFPVLMNDLDRAVEEAFKTRRVVTAEQLVLEVLEHQQEEGRLTVQSEGPDGNALKRELLFTVARAVLDIAYREEMTPIDLIDRPVKAQRVQSRLPDVQGATRAALHYRLPIIQRLGHIPGECTYKVAVGFDWSRITSVNIYVDGAGREALEGRGIKPWYTAVLSQTRQAVTEDKPSSGHVWAEAFHRDYSVSLLLPPPQAVDNTVVIDAPPLKEDSLSVTASKFWPESLLPLEVSLVGSAGHIAPSDGVLRFEGVRRETTAPYRGLRWLDPDRPPKETVPASLSYRMGDAMRGTCPIDLRWGQNNRLDPETVPKLTVAVPSKNRDIDVAVEVAQGEPGPMVNLGRFDIAQTEATEIYLDGELGTTWLRSMFVSSKHDAALTGAWTRVEERSFTLEWPEVKKLRLSVAPDVPEGTALWVAPTMESAPSARLVELGPFPTKLYLLAPANGAPGYLVALMKEDRRSPPPAETGRWLRVEREKLRINSEWLNRLKSLD